MIKNIQPKYQVSDKDYHFNVYVTSIEDAVRINNNLLKSIDFIRTLKKYYTFEKNYQRNNISGFRTGRFHFNDDGTISNVILYVNETHYDDWEGRAPITNSYNETISFTKILNEIVPKVVKDIGEAVSKLNYIKNISNNDIVNNIFDEINIEEKIMKLKEDIKILNYR